VYQDSSVALFMAHRGALIDYASVIVGSRAQAEELVQEAWLRFDRAARRQRLDEPLGYLHRVVRNLALDGRRRLQRESQVEIAGSFDAQADGAPDEQPSPEAAALHKDEFDRLLQAIGELPERTRIALEMHRLGGCRLREIAAFLGVSVPMAHVLVAEGVRHCRRRLDRP
jgi:RNA polymerase sigma-70 factor (ECF subfamily)